MAVFTKAVDLAVQLANLYSDRYPEIFTKGLVPEQVAYGSKLISPTTDWALTEATWHWVANDESVKIASMAVGCSKPNWGTRLKRMADFSQTSASNAFSRSLLLELT